MVKRREPVGEDPFSAIGLDEVVPIGSGGSSLVYRARQRAFDRLIAVKVLSMPLVDERSRRRFERELALAGRLTGHPNVVTQFASGFLGDGRAYVAMEYCPGGSLADRLASSGPFPVRDAVSIGVKVAGVLELAHRTGIVHRDVKPANILVTRFGEPALADFGIAIIAGEMTGTTQALTPVHAAPEVLESRSVGAAADQWSLGSTLHTLLAGRAPFATEDEEGLLAGMLRILNDPVPAIPRADVPEALRAVLGRAMAKDPAARWSSPAELARALQDVERAGGWPVTNLPVEEVAEARYAPGPASGPGLGPASGPASGSAEPPTGEVGPPGSGLDPLATYQVPAPSPAEASPSAQPGIWPTPASSDPPEAPEGHTVRFERGSAPRVAPTDPGGPPPVGAAPPGSPAPGSVVPSPTGPVPTGPVPAGSVPAGEATEHWSRPRVEPPPITTGPSLTEGAGGNRRWWAVAGGAAVVLIVVVVALLVSRGHHATTQRTTTRSVAPPKDQADPSAFAPVNLHITAEQGTSVTLAWTDPAGISEYVVQVIDPADPGGAGNPHVTDSPTQTVVGGLQVGRAYCFAVGSIYSVTEPGPAYAKAVCRAGIGASTTTTPTP